MVDMKTILRIINPMSFDSEKGEILKDERVIEAICESEPKHHLDTKRVIFVSFWDNNTFEEELEKFKNYLKRRIYESQNIEFEIVDERRVDLKHKNLY